MDFPVQRPRRLRRTAALRRLTAEVTVAPANLVQPLFVADGITESEPVPSMPGVVRHTVDSLVEAIDTAAAAGVGGVMLFGVPRERDATGSAALDPVGILNRGIEVAVTSAAGRLAVMSDLCLDEFTDHGHCGVLDDNGNVDNDRTLACYADLAVVQARAGADILGLSGMMDGQVGVVRAALDDAGFIDTALLAYTAKYTSAWYGPFREAVDSQLQGDRATYQQDPANRREAVRELLLDLDEGADIVMVKPASTYQDVIADLAAVSDRPVWAYQVSGEYAAIEAAAANGWLDRDALMFESVLGLRRAGADGVLTYWATELAQRLQ